MHVLFNALSTVTGGSVTYFSNILGPLAARFDASENHRLTVLVSPRIAEQIDRGIPVDFRVVNRVGLAGYRRIHWERRNLANYVGDADVHFVPYQIGQIGLVERTVLMLRNMEPFFHRKYKYQIGSYARNAALNVFSRKALRRADRVIAVSDFARDFAVNEVGLSEAKVRRIYHGRDLSFAPDSHADDHNLLHAVGVRGDYLFTSGSLLPYRRLEDGIEAFARIADRFPRLNLVFAGKGNHRGYERQILNSIKMSEISHRILFLGYVDTLTMSVLYRNARVFIATTEIEACPNTIIEALSSGCAVIASNSKPLPEFVGDAGLYYEARNIDDLVRALIEILDDSKAEKRLRVGAEKAAAKFSWERCARKTFDAITRWDRA